MENYLPHKILKYHLYLFQLEEYDRKRYLRAIEHKGLFPSKKLRKDAVWTTKAKLLTFITVSLIILCGIIDGFILHFLTKNLVIGITGGIISLAICVVNSYFFFIASAILIKPIEEYQKQKIVKAAKEKLKKLRTTNHKLRVIGITGSFGKTTMKETIYTILSQKFRVEKTDSNNNTPLGISQNILKKLNEDTDFFVVEMGEYVKGDVDALCKIARPDISIITGINEAHLERYGTMKNAIDTKFEIVENTPEDGLILLNADDNLTVENHDRFVGNRKIEWFSSKKHKRLEFNEETLKQEFEIEVKGQELKSQTSVLGEYIIGNIVAGTIIGLEAGMSMNEIKFGVSTIKPVKHRLEASKTQNDIVIIDDTYNGNSDGIKAGIELLNKFKNRRKVYITPGLVETGSLEKEIHLQIGRDLAKVADKVVLIKNSVTGYIEKGLIEEGFDEKNIIWFEDSKTTYSSLNKFVKPGDVVMMQNDWSDNYF